MNKELQDLAWSALPKEFKEAVKKIYSHNPGAKPMPENTSRGKAILRDIFGHDNLTFDAEGEEDEMLTISRKEVQEQYRMYRNMGMIKRLDALCGFSAPSACLIMLTAYLKIRPKIAITKAISQQTATSRPPTASTSPP